MATIVVSGALANKSHNGGEAWVRLSWVRGFQKLGCDVHFVEEIRPGTCVDESGAACAFETSANLAYFKRVTEEFGLGWRATLLCEEEDKVHGLRGRALVELAGSADLLVNVSGHLASPHLLGRFRRKAYVDIDPGFTQYWHADPGTRFEVRKHDFYFTIGENISTPGCPIPTGGIAWRPTRQPVVLDDWPVAATACERFTTIASWRGGFGPVQFGGRTFGLKVHEFRKVLPLPGRVQGAAFEIALDIHPGDAKDLAALRDYGWRIADPRAVAATPAAFRDYVQGSGAEFSVAQGIYAETNSGWFSDRSVRYLASGKPVLVQDTGFSRSLPVGEGLVSFRTLEEAVVGAERILRDYDAHCRAARQIAEDFFDSDMVLARFLGECGLAP